MPGLIGTVPKQCSSPKLDDLNATDDNWIPQKSRKQHAMKLNRVCDDQSLDLPSRQDLGVHGNYNKP